MTEELTMTAHVIALLTGMPSSVVGIMFSLGLVARSRYQKYKTNAEKRRHRILDTEVKRQLDFVYSDAYKDFESQVYHLYSNGETDIEVRHREGIDKVPFGSYKTNYKDAIKEVAFKIVLPCIMAKLDEDKKLYKKHGKAQYISETAEDIQKTFNSALGRKVGMSEISEHVEEDTLTVSRFISLYQKIINKARDL